MAEKDFRVRKGLVVDGTSSGTSVAVTTGNVVIADGTLGLTDGLLLSTVSGTPNVSKITSQPTNGDIHIEPNGTGDIVLVTDTLDTTGDALTFKVKDNEAAGLDIATADHSYVKLVTTNSGEELNLAGGFGTITTGAAAVATTITQTSSAANTNAVDLTIKGGSPPTGGTNNQGEGGDIILSAGQGKGTAAGGSIKFNVATPAGSDAATLNALATVMTISDTPNINFHSTNMTNVDINSGAIDGTTIGASASAPATVSTFKARATGYISRVSALQSTTRFQVDGLDTGGALYGNGQTASATGTSSAYAEARLFSDLGGDDLQSVWNDYSGMSGLLVIDNADDVGGLGQGIALTVGEGGSTGDSWAIGRLSGGQSDFTIGYYPKPYEDIGYKHASNAATNDFNPFKAAQSVFKIAKGGDVTLLGNKGDTVDGTTAAHVFNPVSLKFQGVDSGGTTRFTGFTIPAQLASSDSIYTLPDAYPSGSSKVLQSTTGGVLSWVTQSGGITVSGTDHRMVRMDGTTGIQDTGITVDDSDNITGVGTFAATTITSSLGFVSTQDTDGEFIALTLTNESDAADTTGFVSQLFNLEDTSGNAVDAGKIAVKKEESFTSTATTQDSSMIFSTSLNGTLTEQVAIDSDGQVGIGTTTPSYTLDVTAPAATVPTIRVKSTNTGTGPKMRFVHDDGATAQNGDQIATLGFFGESADDSQIEYARIGVKASDVTSGGEGGRIEFFVPKTGNGALSQLDPHMSIISGATVLTSTVDIACNLVVDGDLTVSGDTITANVGTLDVEDKNITLNKSSGDSSSTADGAGITIQDAVDASTDASLLWTASTDRFGFSHGLDVTGTLTADTSLTLDAVTITTAEISVLDGISLDAGDTPDGAVTADKVLAVDANKDLNDSTNHLRDVRMRNLTSTGTVTSTQFSSDHGDIKTVEVASGTINDGDATTIAQIDSTAYRGAEVLTTVYNDTDNTTDLFKTVVMWDGHDTTLNDSAAACHYTNYAVLSSGDVAKGDISAVKNGANIDVKFTSSSGSNDTYVIRAQLILLDI